MNRLLETIAFAACAIVLTGLALFCASAVQEVYFVWWPVSREAAVFAALLSGVSSACCAAGGALSFRYCISLWRT